MEANLLNIVKQQLSSDIIQKAAQFFGEDTAAIQKALSAILPSVLGGLVNQSATDTGASNLMATLSSSLYSSSSTNSLNVLLSGGSATQGLLDSGDQIVKGLFGDKKSGVIDWIASYAGIKAGSSSGLMSVGTSVLMAALGNQISGKNLGNNGLRTFLMGHVDTIIQNLPVGLNSVLGLSNLKLEYPSLSTTAQAEKAASTAQEAENVLPFFKQLLPWLLMLGVGLGGMFYLKMCNTKAPEPPQAIAVEVPVADTVKALLLPEGNISVKTGSFLDQLYTEAVDSTLDAGKALTFDNVNFATSSAELTEDSKIQLDDLTKILIGYPNIAIRIEGHADNKGDAAQNKKLSESRAVAVKKYLTSHGIAESRITTAGFGSDKPVADNNTEKGRYKNRRIEAFIVKK